MKNFYSPYFRMEKIKQAQTEFHLCEHVRKVDVRENSVFKHDHRIQLYMLYIWLYNTYIRLLDKMQSKIALRIKISP